MFSKGGSPKAPPAEKSTPQSDLNGTTACDLEHRQNSSDYDDGAPIPSEPMYAVDEEPLDPQSYSSPKPTPSEEEPNPSESERPSVEAREVTELDWWETLQAEMKGAGKVFLMASMSKGLHQLDGDNLTLTFPSDYMAESIKLEKNYIVEQISKVMGRPITLSIVIKKPEVVVVEEKIDDNIDLYLRVFRGTIIKDKSGDRK